MSVIIIELNKLIFMKFEYNYAGFFRYNGTQKNSDYSSNNKLSIL